jgi:hypothetical protein
VSRLRRPARLNRCRSLEHYKRNPDRLPLGVRVRIWSVEHSAFWRPGGCGYTVHREAAGTWVSQDAFANVRHCDRDKAIWLEFVEPGDTGAEAKHHRHWHEDIGNVLWWRFPIDEPPYVGTPLDCDWPGYHTHFTPLPPIPHQPKRGSAAA